AGAQQKQLPDRIGRDDELAHRIAEREHEDRQQHQSDAGKPRGTLVVGGKLCEETHENCGVSLLWPGESAKRVFALAFRPFTSCCSDVLKTWMPGTSPGMTN